MTSCFVYKVIRDLRIIDRFVLAFNLAIVNKVLDQGALAIRRIFSLVVMIKKPKFSNCLNVFKIGLFR